jgi:4-amino-4-deoxy-L-arabinose transferase-like glycosyltransferase
MDVFGVSVTSLRLPSAFLGALALVPTYYLARSHAPRIAAALTAVLLATTVWFVNFSRSGWENVHIAFYGAMAAWTLSVALRRDRLLLFVLPGLFAGLALNGYFAGKFVPVGLVLYLPFALALNRDRPWRVLLGYALWIAVCIALFAPQVAILLDDWATYMRRAGGVAIFHARLPYHGVSTMEGVLVDQVLRTGRAFVLLSGDQVALPRYSPPWEPIFYPVTGVLYVIGLVVGLVRWRTTALWYCLGGALIVGTQVLTADTPDLARGVGAAPFLLLFASLPLARVFRQPTRLARGLQVGLLLAVALAAWTGVQTYLDWISSPTTLDARKPAVASQDFDQFVAGYLAEIGVSPTRAANDR